MAKIIQWFPGHMKKAMRDMEEKRALCDGVICVLDAVSYTHLTLPTT